jgi:glycine cleavage system aminomethyltransferase T
MDVTHTPLEAGLSFIVDFEKPGGFIGKEALLKRKQAGASKKRIVQFLLEDSEPMLYYGEQIYRNGKWLGYVHSGGYGFTLGASVGLGMIEANEPITPDYIANGKFEIEVNSVRYPAQASLRPLYDPRSERVKS